MELFEQEEEWNSTFLERRESIPFIDDDLLRTHRLPHCFAIPWTTLYRLELTRRFLAIPSMGALFTITYDPRTQNLLLRMLNSNNNLCPQYKQIERCQR